MRITDRETDGLLVFVAAEVARRRRHFTGRAPGEHAH